MTDTTAQIAELLGDHEALEDDFEEQQGEGQVEEQEVEEQEESDESQEDVTWGKALGIDEDKVIVDDTGNISGIKVKVDDVESVVVLKDLVAGYQFNAHNTQRSQALARERNEFAEQINQQKQALQAELQTQAQLANVIASQVLGEYENIDWDKYAQANPQEARMARAEYIEKSQYFSKLTGAVQQQLAVYQQEQAAQQQAQQENFVKQQLQTALTLIPEWSDKSVVSQDLESIKTVMSSYGFSDEDLAGVQDARIFPLLRDLAKYKNALNNVQKTVQPVGKVKQHGNTGNVNANKVNRLVSQARKSSNNYQSQQLKTQAVAELLSGI